MSPHAWIIAMLTKTPVRERADTMPEGYAGSKDFSYKLSVPTLRSVAHQFRVTYPNLTQAEFEALLDRLYAGNSHEEKCFGGYLLSRYPKVRAQIQPASIDRWLTTLHGWNQVDCLCQNVFPAEQILASWKEWQQFLNRLQASTQPEKQRASLVLLTFPVHKNPDPRLARQAVNTITALAGQRDILITKAISWLMRSLITHHRETVETLLQSLDTTLPAIAKRETRNKLATGKK